MNPTLSKADRALQAKAREFTETFFLPSDLENQKNGGGFSAESLATIRVDQ
jgi:hypothetical protein